MSSWGSCPQGPINITRVPVNPVVQWGCCPRVVVPRGQSIQHESQLTQHKSQSTKLESQWGSMEYGCCWVCCPRIRFVLGMSISCGLSSFWSPWVGNVNTVSGGIYGLKCELICINIAHHPETPIFISPPNVYMSNTWLVYCPLA